MKRIAAKIGTDSSNARSLRLANDAVFALPRASLAHADAHVGNLIRNASGVALLTDFNATCGGPPAVDLVPEPVIEECFGQHGDGGASDRRSPTVPRRAAVTSDISGLPGTRYPPHSDAA
jgi:aminoglycoside phosphotransferase (APT) family kinase protein